jgi:cytochrome c peroxidase
MPGASRFDAYVEAAIRRDARAMETTLTKDEIAGLRLFMGKGELISMNLMMAAMGR